MATLADLPSEQPVFAYTRPGNLVQTEDIPERTRAEASHGFPRVATTQDLWGVEKRDPVYESLQDERGVYFTTAFDQQAGDVFRTERLQQP